MLVHQDAEIVDAGLLRGGCGAPWRIPDVGVVGCVGAIGTRSIAWWEAPAGRGSAIYRYGECGRGRAAAVLGQWRRTREHR